MDNGTEGHTGANAAQRRPRFDPLTTRVLLIGFLALLMLVPLAFVNDVVSERSQRYASILNDIARTWGQPQILQAPVLAVPFTETVTRRETITSPDGRSRVVNKSEKVRRVAQFLPDTLNIDVTLTDEIRRRGLFESLVYNANITLKASFSTFEGDAVANDANHFHWDKAWIAAGLTDTKAINSVSSFTWNDKALALSQGTRIDALPAGFHGTLDPGQLDPGQLGPGQPYTGIQSNHVLSMQLEVKGSGLFQFAPMGETTSVTVESRWPHPSFLGSALPDSHSVNAEGFNATWNIPHLARNYPQHWVTGDKHTHPDLFEFIAGVRMFEPVSLYTIVTRAVKYGILFIGLTFLTLLVFEITVRERMHVVQYALIGISLSLFFLVLLSLSEHIQLLHAYLLAAGLTIMMISGYTWVVLRSIRRAGTILAVLASLYAVLYSLLQLEDYALLTGTGLLVFVVLVLMVVTRNINNPGAT